MSESRDVKTVFFGALDLPEELRLAYLDEQCGDDVELRREVESLLASHGSVGTFLEHATRSNVEGSSGAVFTDDRVAVADPVPERIGSYRIVRELGRGGMGIVYIAVRTDDRFRKTVALKVLKRGMDSAEFLERFELERQVLSALNHPNVARLLDGGLSEDGRPYFALEYIEGEPIDEYCDSHRLRTSERLELFAQVCRAVHYAHQNLVVHRDIKPGNILVTKGGVPKLLDFGIAKLLNPDLTAVAADPTGEIRLMTPEYASPEQVTGKPITTATDIYSLGVVLYELLSGHRPYRIRTRLHEEVVRIVCDEDPERPSNAITRTEEVPSTGHARRQGPATRLVTPESVCRTRDGRVDRLRRRLRGDIDNIVLMALRRPQRRYASAETFAEDLERHLEGFPVTARPDGVPYRASKFVRRNKAGIAITATVLVAAFATVVAVAYARVAAAQSATAEKTRVALAATVRQREAESARAKAEAARREAIAQRNERLVQSIRDVRTLLLEDVYDAIERLPDAIDARELIVNEVLELLERDAGHADDDWTIQLELARARDRLGDITGGLRGGNRGDVESARQHYSTALGIVQAVAADRPDDDDVQAELAYALGQVGDTFRDDDSAAALDHYERALRIQRSLVRRQPERRDFRRGQAKYLLAAGDMLNRLRRRDEAQRRWRESFTIREELAALSDDVETQRDLALGHSRLALGRRLDKDLDGAIEEVERCLEIRRRLAGTQGAEHDMSLQRDLAMTWWQLGRYRLIAERHEAAREDLLKSVELLEPLQLADPANERYGRDLATAHELIGQTLELEERLEEALAAYQRQRELAAQLVANAPSHTGFQRVLGYSYLSTGRVLERLERPVAAAVDYTEFLRVVEPLLQASAEDEKLRDVVDSAREARDRLKQQ